MTFTALSDPSRPVRRPRPRGIACALPLLLSLSAVGAAAAQDAVPTRVVVRAVANDAKIIGSGVGGARITLRDAATGEVLAEGVQEGSTGNTGLIMGPRERGATVFDTEGAAAFEATLDLAEPTLLEVEAEGPLSTPHATRRATTTVLVVPGEDIVGEGLIVVLDGLTVELLDARPAGRDVAVRARVTMLCGCPTEPGGTWDSTDWLIEARLVRDGRVHARAPLAFSGETSVYAGTVTAPDGGDWELQVVAVDAERANTGLVRGQLTLGG